MLEKIFICIFGMIKYFIIECSSGLHIVHIAAEMAPVAKVIFVIDSVFHQVCDLIILFLDKLPFNILRKTRCKTESSSPVDCTVSLFLVLHLNWNKGACVFWLAREAANSILQLIQQYCSSTQVFSRF